MGRELDFPTLSTISTCLSGLSDEQAWFSVHNNGVSCNHHLPNGAPPPPWIHTIKCQIHIDCLIKSLMEDLTAFQRDLLYIINGLDAPKGLAIKDELDEYYEKEVNHGRLYPNLNTLVDMGLVKKGQQDNRTNAYTLTNRAHREIEVRREWENEYVSLNA